MKLANTPITQHQFDGIPFFLKRDDQLHSHFSGNKARKFMALLELEATNIDTLICYGSAQANSLYSLAALSAIKGWQLEFYVDRIPNWLMDNPIGNYRGALDLGAKVIPVADSHLHPVDYIEQIRQPDQSCLVIPEGGRTTMSKQGINQLASEILSWSRFETNHQFVVALPAGTGTTALYLHNYLKPHGIEVLTCPCVGGKDYLVQQFIELGESDHPTILELETKHHFGKLYQQDYAVWQQLLSETDIEFDLLYDPMMWRCLQSWYKDNLDKTIIYVHQGGILGNESMLPRYERKYGVI
ncbi:1-aminocyclopropane-1-carboxylate deaminase [Vibrio orientalis CIP 102891 = ATCC 33934]|uniref:1-aminocyclopropane-1-carboxylate deaminase n=1 Tax=Vibrio orientalis CIP 102891 = ATCC 33934 TaxID=675816 RepID=C9QJS7_VIBOR|nr:pyridoxal-phosphate dependent enzyme [Vibrio orientalis]EEX91922.1 1-aminocyclopropane-1-carboxylate deaminase [Vibrio orientalis CIP 102891 = ATCC 33934]EGU53751.1 1-aminocyclopropane-1-carboxylate deaminase [Vibrio orientalis CIP 102891 = ATCC 33934]